MAIAHIAFPNAISDSELLLARRTAHHDKAPCEDDLEDYAISALRAQGCMLLGRQWRARIRRRMGDMAFELAPEHHLVVEAKYLKQGLSYIRTRLSKRCQVLQQAIAYAFDWLELHPDKVVTAAVLTNEGGLCELFTLFPDTGVAWVRCGGFKTGVHAPACYEMDEIKRACARHGFSVCEWPVLARKAD